MLKKLLIMTALICFSRADDVSLCGDPSTQIDLTNSLNLQLSGNTTFFSGSVFVLTVPDLRSADVWDVTGTVRVPYRFRLSGEVLDNNGGTWGNPQMVADDQRGITALAFVLENGNLPPGTQITLKDITVWQYASDGPRSVIVTIDFWGAFNKGKTQQVAKYRSDVSRFVSCSEWTDSAPIPICKSLGLIDGQANFHLEGIDPELAPHQLDYALVQEPQHGTLDLSGSAYRYQAGTSFSGFDELVFSVSDGESIRQGRICFFRTTGENWISFPSHEGLVFQGSDPGHFQPKIMSYAMEPASVQFVLDGQNAPLPLSINSLSEGTHLLSAELRSDADQRLLAQDFLYLFRSEESGEIFLEHLGSDQESGVIRAGRYCGIDLRSFDDHDEFIFNLERETQPSVVTITDINSSTLKASVSGERNDLWCVTEKATQSWAKHFLPGETYLLQLDDDQALSASYSLDILPDFSRYAIPVLSEGDRVVLVNPHALPVIVDVSDRQSLSRQMLLQPGQGMTLGEMEGFDGPGAYFVQSSMSVDIVVVQSESGALSASTFPFGASQNGLLPHLAAQTDVWENQFVFASDTSHDLVWEYANGLGENLSLEVAGVAVFNFPGMPPMPNQSWARFNSDETVCLDGYARFRRKDSSRDHSVITGVRNDFFGPSHTARSLYLPHVAADRELFWTGYSVLNPHPTRNATLLIRGMSDSGEELARETTTLSPGSQEVSVIGIDRFDQQEQVAWVRIDSSLPLRGIEMFGGNGNQGFLAGFLLPSVPVATLVFPFAVSDEHLWSGVALINSSDVAQEVNISFSLVDGGLFEAFSTNLGPKSKTTFLVPENFRGVVRCDSTSHSPCLLGFALLGDRERTALAGYLGM